MISKEKLQKHIQSLNEIKYRYPILYDTIKYLEEYQKTLSNPTLDDCIKEWVKKEWEYIITDDKVLYLWKKENSTTTNTIIYNLKVKELKFNFNFISIELLELLTKTLKAWEGMKDEQV